MNSLELFSGGGGLALGLELAGFTHLGLVERDRDSCATLRHNRPDWPVFECDVAAFDFASYKHRVDVLAAGAPCQPFSLGGKHAGQNDQRNLFPQVVRAVRETVPKAFLLENVRGLTRKSFLPYFHYIIAQLKQPSVLPLSGEDWFQHHERLGKASHHELAYDVDFRVLNAAEHGVPQFRHRVIIVGIRRDLGLRWDWPEVTHTRDALRLAKKSGDYWREHKIDPPKADDPIQTGLLVGAERWQTLRDCLRTLSAPGAEPGEVPNHVLITGARPYKGHTGSCLDEPAKTIKAGDHGVPGGENTFTDADGAFRYLTVREAARVQTFPDDWVFTSSRTESMRQIGNAVPVQLARAVGVSLRNCLEGAYSREQVTRFPSRPAGQLLGR